MRTKSLEFQCTKPISLFASMHSVIVSPYSGHPIRVQQVPHYSSLSPLRLSFPIILYDVSPFPLPCPHTSPPLPPMQPFLSCGFFEVSYHGRQEMRRELTGLCAIRMFSFNQKWASTIAGCRAVAVICCGPKKKSLQRSSTGPERYDLALQLHQIAKASFCSTARGAE